MLITSAGIFGFLSNAYQGATVQFEKQSNELLALEDRLEQLEDDRTFLKDEFEQSVNDLPENYITAKRKLREQFNPQIQKLNEQILNVKSRKSDLEISLIETGVDVGPAIYLARVFDTDIDSVVKFFIFILIFVFDPLAIAMVVAANMAFAQVKGVARDPKDYEVYQEKEPTEEEIKEKYIKEEGDLSGPRLKSSEETPVEVTVELKNQKPISLGSLSGINPDNMKNLEEPREDMDPEFKKRIQETIKHAKRAGIKIPKNFQ